MSIDTVVAGHNPNHPIRYVADDNPGVWVETQPSPHWTNRAYFTEGGMCVEVLRHTVKEHSQSSKMVEKYLAKCEAWGPNQFRLHLNKKFEERDYETVKAQAIAWIIEEARPFVDHERTNPTKCVGAPGYPVVRVRRSLVMHEGGLWHEKLEDDRQYDINNFLGSPFELVSISDPDTGPKRERLKKVKSLPLMALIGITHGKITGVVRQHVEFFEGRGQQLVEFPDVLPGIVWLMDAEDYEEVEFHPVA